MSKQTAAIFYPWQQTGYLRGRTAEGLLLMTVASVPIFDLESPPSLTLTRRQAGGTHTRRPLVYAKQGSEIC